MLLTPTDVDQFGKGDMKGDMGRKTQGPTALVRNCVNMFGRFNVGLVATNRIHMHRKICLIPDDKITYMGKDLSAQTNCGCDA